MIDKHFSAWGYCRIPQAVFYNLKKEDRGTIIVERKSGIKNASTYDAHRKYFQQPTKVLSLALASTFIFLSLLLLSQRFVFPTSRKNKGCDYALCSPTRKSGLRHRTSWSSHGKTSFFLKWRKRRNSAVRTSWRSIGLRRRGRDCDKLQLSRAWCVIPQCNATKPEHQRQQPPIILCRSTERHWMKMG